MNRRIDKFEPRFAHGRFSDAEVVAVAQDNKPAENLADDLRRFDRKVEAVRASILSDGERMHEELIDFYARLHRAEDQIDNIDSQVQTESTIDIMT